MDESQSGRYAAEKSIGTGHRLRTQPMARVDPLVENGALQPDNNTAENASRPIALGRKNYLFVGSEYGGRRAAILYSLIRTCERHQINALDYLNDVLVRISTHPASQIDDLLPHRWTPAVK